MSKCPKVGDVVSYAGAVHVGPCKGVVTAIYPTFEWDEERDRPTTATLPEREWHVGMKPDALPSPWCYTGSDTFAPAVSALKLIRKARGEA